MFPQPWIFLIATIFATSVFMSSLVESFPEADKVKSLPEQSPLVLWLNGVSIALLPLLGLTVHPLELEPSQNMVLLLQIKERLLRKISIVGTKIGNPLLDFDTDMNAVDEYYWSHGIITDYAYKIMTSLCFLREMLNSGMFQFKKSHNVLQTEEPDQVGGWTQVYGNHLTYATVRGASHGTPVTQGHMAPCLKLARTSVSLSPKETGTYVWWMNQDRVIRA
ncbi:hypothetical protein JHK87_053381 [Glycine soja]|nr:hypothetical protein JHK87_053381 [Glycine soja]